MTEQTTYQKKFNNEEPISYIIGGGEAAEIFLKNSISYQYSIAGIFDDNTKLHGKKIEGVPILGFIRDLGAFLDKKIVKNIIYLIPSIHIGQYIDLFNEIRNKYPNIEWFSTPPLNDISQGLKSLFELTNLNLIPVNKTSTNLSVSDYQKQKVLGKSALITGGAGSIGSQLVGELLLFDIFETIVVVDNNEMNAYKLSQDFAVELAQRKLFIHLIDFGEVDEMNDLLVCYQPAYVYHVGAYKHVNILEGGNVYSAINNNVIKSIKLLNVTLTHDFVKTFVLVSSDKAVNPKSVMGYTKRLTELCFLSLCSKSSLDMITVRFGNVVGSSGSVFHKFLKQIQGRQKITLTDLNVTRYFMNISQAASLIIKSSLIGERNRVYVLNMGDPVKIYDFLMEMINKHGDPSQINSIAITGLHTGEKLEEELHYLHENIKPLDNDIFASDSLVSEINTNKILEQFKEFRSIRDEKKLKSWLHKSISSYEDGK